MRGIRINKIAAIGLLMVLVIGFGQANGWLSPLEGDVDQEMYITGGYPKVGEVFEAVYRVRLKEENSLNKHPEKMVAMGYVIHFSSRPMDPVTFITEKEIFVPVLNPREWREFSAKLRITKGATNIQIQAGTHFKASKSGAHGAMSIYLLDPETGQYGTKEEYEGKLPVEHRYDPVDGSFTCSPDRNPAPVEENRRIIKMIRDLEPRLSDSLALLLHSDQYRVGVPKGLPRWDEENKRWLEEEIFEYYLNDGWFEALHAGKREAWIIQEREKIMKEVDKHKLNFFRDNNSSNSDYLGSNNPPKDRITTTFIGQIC